MLLTLGAYGSQNPFEVEGATIGAHPITAYYDHVHISDDHDGLLSGAGEWYFYLIQGGSERDSTGEISVDGAQYVDVDLEYSWIASSNTSFSCKAGEWDGVLGWDSAAESIIDVQIDLDGSAPNQWQNSSQIYKDVRHYYGYFISNSAPVVSNISGPSTIHPGDLDVEYAANASDLDGDGLTYEWRINGIDYPEKTDATSSWNITDSPAALGNWTVEVRAKDALGTYSDWYAKEVSCINEPPSLNPIMGSDTCYRGDTLTFNISGYDPEGDYPLSYEWTINGYDMNVNDSTLSFVQSLEPESVGESIVTVLVYDSLGAFTEATKNYTTLNHAPIVSIISGPTSGYRETEYTFIAAATDLDASDSLEITWYINGTSQATGTNFTHTFDTETAGEYLIQAVAQDSIGTFSNYANHSFTLMEPGPFYCCFEVPYEEEIYLIETCSNSTVTDLTFSAELKRIRFNVNGITGIDSFCNITIPTEVLSGGFSVYMDDAPLVEDVDYIVMSNVTHHTLSTTYAHSSHIVDVYGTYTNIPDFASLLFLPFVLLATLLCLVLGKKLKKQKLV